MSVVHNPAAKHRCRNEDLPSEEGLVYGAIVSCHRCGRYFVYAPIPWEQVFRPVWPWEFGKKKLIRDWESRNGK